MTDDARARIRSRLGVEWPAANDLPDVLRRDEPSTHVGYTRTALSYRGARGTVVPAWLLEPAASIPSSTPAAAGAGVVVAHGHGTGHGEVVGLDGEGVLHEEPWGFHQNLGVRLARAGLTVLVPEFEGFGSRRDVAHERVGGGGWTCPSLAWPVVAEGRSLLGDRVDDTLRARALLASLPSVAAGRVGVAGGSGGGAIALYAAAVEPRFAAAAVASYFCDWTRSIFGMPHCACNYAPGMLVDGGVEEVGALVAPRPLFVESGETDPIFPLPGVRDAYAALAERYRSAGAERALAPLHVHPGGHVIDGEPLVAFLTTALGL